MFSKMRCVYLFFIITILNKTLSCQFLLGYIILFKYLVLEVFNKDPL